MIIRVSIANLTPADAAKLGQASGFAGSVYANIGFGSWEIEHGVTFEFALTPERNDGFPSALHAWIRVTLKARDEQAAYVAVNGRDAFLLWQDGREERVAG